MSFAEIVDLAKKVAAQLVLLSLIVVSIIHSREGKDERGTMIFNHFYRVMFMLLSTCIVLIMVVDSIISYDVYKDLVGLSLCLSYILGTVYLLILRKKY